MKESDIRLILGAQTKLPVELVDVLKLDTICSSRREAALASKSEYRKPSAELDQSLVTSAATGVVLFDTLQEEHLPVIGEVIDGMAKAGQLFTVGSSGVEYALTAHWHRQGRARCSVRATDFAKPVKQIVAVSGSCSPVTDRQIGVALENGFREFPIHARRLPQEGHVTLMRMGFLLDVRKASSKSRGLILHTSRGPGDKRFVKGKKTAERISKELGPALAAILEDLIDVTGIRRAVVCGGDTSMHVARALGIEALEYVGPMAPGSPLCKVHAPGRIVDGMEFVFKGGQVGRDRFFLDVLNGGPIEEQILTSG